MKYFFILLTFYCSSSNCQEDTFKIFIDNIPIKVFKLENKMNTFLDLNKRTFIKIGSDYTDSDKGYSEENIDLECKVIKGPFLKKYQSVYIFSVGIKYGPWGSAEGVSENVIYIFDLNYNLIEGPIFNNWFFDDWTSYDLNNDSIHELYCEVSWGRMGQSSGLLFVYDKFFSKEMFSVGLYSNFDGMNSTHEYYNIDSDYYFIKNELIIDYRIEHYLGLGEEEKRFIKTENKKNIYSFKKGKFKLLKSGNNFLDDSIFWG